MEPAKVVSTETVDGKEVITVEVSSLKALQDFIPTRPDDQQILVRISDETTQGERKLINLLCNLTVAPYYGPRREDCDGDDQLPRGKGAQGESSGASQEKKDEKDEKRA